MVEKQAPINERLAQDNGLITRIWSYFFRDILDRIKKLEGRVDVLEE